MKNITRAVLCFGLFFCLIVGKVKALSPVYDVQVDDIKIMPVVTVAPTTNPYKPIKDIEMEIMPLATKTPTPIIVTQVVTATPQPTVSTTEVKPTETETITQEPSVAETEETLGEGVEKTEEKEEKTDSNNWFWGAIIGLLALILVAQVWSTKKNEENRSKKENL